MLGLSQVSAATFHMQARFSGMGNSLCHTRLSCSGMEQRSKVPVSNYSGGSYAGSSFQVEDKGEDDEHQQVGAHQLLAGPLKPCHGWTTCYAFLTCPSLWSANFYMIRRCVGALQHFASWLQHPLLANPKNLYKKSFTHVVLVPGSRGLEHQKIRNSLIHVFN